MPPNQSARTWAFWQNLGARLNGARCGALAAVLLWGASAGSLAAAQGFDYRPWNPRTPAPALAWTDLDGHVWRGADLRGSAVLLNFWASWCEPCRAEMPSLQALAQRPGLRAVQVLTINFKESPALAQQFMQRSGLHLPVVADPQGALARAWGITVFPSTVLIGADGRVRLVVRGEVDWEGQQAAQWLDALFAVRQ